MSRFSKTAKRTLAVVALSCPIIGAAQVTLDAHREAFGFGDISGKIYQQMLTPAAQTKLRHVTEIVFWNRFESSDDAFDDVYIHNQITSWASQGIYVFLDIRAGSASPEFLDTDFQVPYKTNDDGKRWFNVYNSDYKAEYQEMLKRLIDSVAMLPQADSDYVVAIGINMGKDNDFHAPQWPDDLVSLAKELYTLIDAYMNSKQSALPNTRLSFSLPAWNEMLDNPAKWSLVTWVRQNLTHPWTSIDELGQGYGLNEEKTLWRHMGKNYLWSRINGEFPFNRSAVSIMGNNGLCWENYKPWHSYWLALYNMHWGTGLLSWDIALDYFDENGNKFIEVYDFLNRYAGEKDGLGSPGAFIALRDGLDALDLSRFPVSVYGPADTHQDIQTRAQLIINDFATDGATLGNASIVTAGAMAGSFKYGDIDTGILNDIGTNVFDGPYKLHITLMNKNDLIGKWQVGPIHQFYGRFALEVPTEKQIRLDLEDQLFADGSLEADSRVKFRVVYLDDANSNFSIKYDAIHDPDKLLATIQTSDSGDWATWESAWIDDAKFANRGQGGADLYIDNTGAPNTMHMIEVIFENDRQKSSDNSSNNFNGNDSLGSGLGALIDYGNTVRRIAATQ